MSTAPLLPDGSGTRPLPAPGEVLWVDRRDEAQRLVDLAFGAGSSLVLLYGRRGIGKTSLVRGWALDLVAPRGRGWYADCAGALPERVATSGGEVADLWSAAAQPGLVFLDSFETVLDLPGERREPLLEDLCARARAGARAVIALVFDEDRLGEAFALRAYLPHVLQAAFEIRGLDTGDCLAAVRSALQGGDLGYAPEVLDALAAEARAGGGGLTPDLLKAVDAQLRRRLDGPGRPEVGLAEYRASGGLPALLRAHLASRLEELAAAGELERDLGLAVLDEVAAAVRAGAGLDLEGLAARAGAGREEIARALARLEDPGGLLRAREGGAPQLVPGALAGAVAREVARQVADAQRVVRQGAEVRREIGALLPAEAFEAAHQRRRLLRLTPEEVELMLCCAVRHDASEDLAAARYWLGRTTPEQAGVEALSLLLADPLPAVRGRAASLLAGYDEPGVRNQLHLAALRDPEPEVRARALASLERMASEDLGEFLIQEASDLRSPHREAAIDMLRISRDPRAVGILRRIVDDAASPRSLRARAIATLAELEVPEAAGALVEVALADADQEDREDAAAALAAARSEPLLAYGLQALRTLAPVKGELAAGWRTAAKLALRVAAALAVTLANFLLHGLGLLLLRRYLAGLGLLALEGLGVVLGFYGAQTGAALGLGDTTVPGWCLLYLTWLAGHAAPMGILLLGLRERRVRPGSFQSALGATLFAVLAFFPFGLPLVHGLAHAAIRRFRRAFTFFGLELAGLFLLWLIAVRPQIFNITVSRLPEELLYNLLLSGYTVLGIVLLGVSYLFDVFGVAGQTLLFTRTIEAEQRRRQLYSRLLANPAAARQVLGRLTGPDRGEASWARTLLRRHGRSIDPSLLVGLLGEGDRRLRRWVDRNLAARPAEAVPLLRKAWEDAGPAQRRRIAQALARRPTQTSADALRDLGPQLGWGGRLRARLASWHFRFRVWPKLGIAALLACLPLFVLFSFEGVMTLANPARPQVKILRSEAKAWQGADTRLRVGAAKYLAEAFPEAAVEPLAYVLDRTADEDVQVAAADALVQVAGRDLSPGLRQDVAKVLATRLRTQPAPRDATIRSLILAGLQRVAGSNAQALDGVTPALVGLLRHPREASETRYAALATLEAGRAVEELAGFVATTGGAYGPGGDIEEEEEELRLEALAALGRISTLAAHAKLRALALPGAGLPLSLEDRAASEAREPLRRFQTDLDQERYDELLRDAAGFLDKGQGGLDASFPWRDLLLLAGRAHRGRAGHRADADPAGAGHDREQAIEYLERARDLEPLGPEDARLLADSYAAQGDWLAKQSSEAAAERWRQALALGQALPPARRAELLLALGDSGQARQEALAAIEQDPADYRGFRLLRRAFHAQDEDYEAVAAFEELARRYPRNPLPRFNMAAVYNDYLSATDEAAYEKAYRSFVAIPPEQRRPYQRAKLAEISLNSGRYRGAVQIARQLVRDGELEELRSPEAVILALQVIAYAGEVLLGQLEPARRQLERVAGLYGELPADYRSTWEWAGVVRHLERAKGLPQERRDALLALLGILGAREPGPVADGVFERNRAALGATAPP